MKQWNFAVVCSAVCLCTLLSVTGLRAQAPGDPESAKVLAEIESLKKLFYEGSDKNNERALAAIKNALSSPKATYEFYMESRKKLDFDDVGKRESDWREWRDKNEDGYKETEHLMARQLQLRYLALTIRASDSLQDEVPFRAVLPELASFLDSMTGSVEKLADQAGVLRGSVMSSTFAKRMKLDMTVNDDFAWCLSPLNVSRIYDTTVLPFHRSEKNAVALAGAWDKRIGHEAKLATLAATSGGGGGMQDLIRRYRGGSDRDREREERREEQRKSKVGEEDFKTERLPELQWGKTRDALFFGTDRNASLRAMTALVKANLTHERARDWLEELSSLAESATYDPDSYYGGE